MRLLLTAVVATTLLVTTAVPAAAGGWWSTIRVQGREFGSGETVVATSEAFFTTVEEANEALSSEHFAYLVGDYDRGLLAQAQRRAEPRRWWSVPAGAAVHQIGRVRLHSMDANVGRAVSRMTIPQVRPGRYIVMFCDQGCRRPLAHVVPTQALWITSDAVAARAARRADAVAGRTLSQLSELREELRDARRDAAQALSAADATHDAQRALELALATPRDDTRWPALVAALAAGIALSALLAAGVLLRARQRTRREAATRWRPPPGVPRDPADEFEMAGH